MSYRISLCTGLIGLSATLALVQPNVASAKSSVEIGAVAKSITVQIVGENNSGSGVILQRQGDTYTVLTVAHAVDNSTNYKIVTPDDRSYQIVPNSIRIASGGIDLAVVKFKSTTKYATAKLGNSNALKEGMDLYVAGFPNKSLAITESVFALREGKVTANSSKDFGKGYSLIYSNVTVLGMSGGAVLNGNGELVAIHGMGDREQLDDGGFGDKTGLNLGISINRFAMVASNMGVPLGGQVTPMPRSTVGKPDDYFVSGIQKYRKGNIQGALADFNQAIVLNPKYSLAYGNRGIAKDDLNDLQGALADYDRAISLDPKYAKAYNNRAALKEEKLSDFQGALADYDRAIALKPKAAYIYQNRGDLKRSKLNDIQGAMADFSRAIALNPKNADAYNSRASLKHYKLNDIQGALADYNQSIALDPKSGAAYYNRTFLKSRLNDFQGALADWNQFIALNPKESSAYLNRAALKIEKLNDLQGALADYDRAISLDPKNASAYTDRGNLKKYKLNDEQGALVDFQQAEALSR